MGEVKGSTFMKLMGDTSGIGVTVWGRGMGVWRAAGASG